MRLKSYTINNQSVKESKTDPHLNIESTKIRGEKTWSNWSRRHRLRGDNLRHSINVCYHIIWTEITDPMDCSLPGSFVHGILQARLLEWEVILFFRGPSWLRDQTQVSCSSGRFFNIWATREAQHCMVSSAQDAGDTTEESDMGFTTWEI